MTNVKTADTVRERERERELHFNKEKCGIVQQSDPYTQYILPNQQNFKKSSLFTKNRFIFYTKNK